MSNFDASIMSDLHKDAYGFRPSKDAWDAWEMMTAEEVQDDIDYMIALVERSIKEENEQQSIAVEEFEAQISSMCLQHNINRDTAIRWDMEAYNTVGDTGYHEYHRNLPYGYLTKVAIAA